MWTPALFTIKSGDFDMRGHEVARTQFFASASIMGASFSRNGIRFSNACIRKFIRTEYIELHVNPYKQLIAVLPCSKQHKTAMCWARIYADRISVRTISGAAFIKTLFDLFDWDFEMRYRLRGEILQYDEEKVALFDVRTPEIFVSRYDMTMPWATGFGENYYHCRALRFLDAPVVDIFAEYSNEPGLQPTIPESARENVRLLIERLQSDGGSSCDSTDILT